MIILWIMRVRVMVELKGHKKEAVKNEGKAEKLKEVDEEHSDSKVESSVESRESVNSD